MPRTFTYSALTLRTRPSGESNREAWFLTAEEGIIHATVFGGPKSRLRSHVAAFHQGQLWVYHDPVKDSRKVTDFDVRSWRPGLREVYERSAAAAAVAETVLAGHGGGGSWGAALDLASAALDALDSAGEELCRPLFTGFLWNWAEILGIRPGIDHCASCACEAGADGVLWFQSHEGALLCPKCAALGASGIPLIKVDGSVRRWLKAAGDVRSPAFSRPGPDKAGAEGARSFTTALLAGALGKHLKTWTF